MVTNMTTKGAGTPAKNDKIQEKIMKNPHNANLTFTSCHVNSDLCTELRSSNNENNGVGGGKKGENIKRVEETVTLNK